MATNFLVDLILSGHDVFLLDDEETYGHGEYRDSVAGSGNGSGNGYDAGYGAGYGESRGYGSGSGFGSSSGPDWDDQVETKDEYGYQFPG